MFSDTLSEDILAPIRAVFFVECDELVGEIEAGLLALQGGARDTDIVDAVFRAAHSIKGSAGAFGFWKLGQFSHALESAMEAVRARTVDLDAGLFSLLLRATDVLADMVQAARGGDDGAHAADDSEFLVAALSALAPPRPEQAAPEEDFEGVAFTPAPITLALCAPPRRWTIRMRPHAALYAAANEPLLLLRELGRLGELSVELDATALPALEDLRPEEAYLSWTIGLTTTADEATIREVFAFVDDVCDLSLEDWVDDANDVPGPQAVTDANLAEPPTPTIRVDLERIDRLINLVGELVINQSMLRQRLGDAGLSAGPAVEQPLDDLAHLARDLQDSVMAIRAQPVKVVFQRLLRVVRDVSAETGKRVRLSVAGEDTQVDRTVIERLTDPLTHMIRNAIDHGIETPAARLAAGKPEEGLLQISAAHRGGRIVESSGMTAAASTGRPSGGPPCDVA